MDFRVDIKHAAFFQPEKDDGHYHLVIEADVLGLLPAQGRLVEYVFGSPDKNAAISAYQPQGDHSKFVIFMDAPRAGFEHMLENERRAQLKMPSLEEEAEELKAQFEAGQAEQKQLPQGKPDEESSNGPSESESKS